MAKFAVAVLNYADNANVVEVVEAEDAFDAVLKHSLLQFEGIETLREELDGDSDRLDSWLFDGDISAGFVEIK